MPLTRHRCLCHLTTEVSTFLFGLVLQGGDLLHNLMEGGCLTEMQASSDRTDAQ